MTATATPPQPSAPVWHGTGRPSPGEAQDRWEAARDFLSRQPGCVSTRPRRALRPDARFRLVDVAEWASAEAFQAAAARMRRELAAPPPPGLRSTPGLHRVVRE